MLAIVLFDVRGKLKISTCLPAAAAAATVAKTEKIVGRMHLLNDAEMPT